MNIKSHWGNLRAMQDGVLGFALSSEAPSVAAIEGEI